MNKTPAGIPTLISIIPNLVGGEGHIIPYHLAIEKVSQILGWKHQVAYSHGSIGEHNCNDLPSHWDGCLRGSSLEADVNFFSKIGKLIDVISFAQSIYDYLAPQFKDKSQVTIIFIERFIHLQLLALWLGILFLPKDNLFVWILYRRDIHKSKNRFLYKWLNKLLEKTIISGNFKLLTDSELLSKSLSNYFAQPVITMPIPHTEVFSAFKGDRQDYITCWWAGPPREEKGWQIIKDMVDCQFPQAHEFCLAAAKSSNLQSKPGGIRVELVADNLTREEYKKWLAILADIILIPYEAGAYKERTSGIFTECIIAGNIPLVTADTWMAAELSKFNLSELIANWQEPKSTFAKIKNIIHDQNIINKLTLMQTEYKKFHNLETYAHKFLEIFGS